SAGATRRLARQAALLPSTRRNRECKRRTHSHLARDPDLAAVEFDKLPAQRQPKPGTLHLLRRCPRLPELLAHRFLILRGDAHPGVSDRYLYRSDDSRRAG